jgi:MFS transporter, SP family, sugar:H+ symporter
MGFSFLKHNRFAENFTPRLALAVSLIALSTFNYGFDNQGIATSQAMHAYKQQFGVFNPTTKTFAIPPYFLSLLNSLNFIGFAVGRSRSYLRPVALVADLRI